MSEAGCNRDKEPIHVNWMLLKQASPHSDNHKVDCPACEDGILTMMRSSETGILLEYDMCVVCSQIVIYDDIDFVRKTYP